MMTLETCLFKKLLPVFMRKDGANSAFSNYVDRFAHEILDMSKLYSVWNKIDDLTEEQLDELAWEKNITWYLYDANVEMKRQIIKGADEIKRHLGTKWALEQVVNIYFGSGEVKEWYEYSGGEPLHFKIRTTNTETIDEEAIRFLKVVNTVKRQSAVLDVIEIIEAGQLIAYYTVVGRRVEVNKTKIL